jgi:hypothetical protein
MKAHCESRGGLGAWEARFPVRHHFSVGARFWSWITGLIGVIFNDAPHRNPGFQGKCPHFFSPENLLDPFSGGVSVF